MSSNEAETPKASRPKDQSTHLPQYKPGFLPEHPPDQILTKPQDYITWVIYITGILESLKLTRLVDIYLLTPRPDSKKWKNWYTFSRELALWLKNSINPDFLKWVLIPGKDDHLTLAYTVYDAIRRRFEGGPQNNSFYFNRLKYLDFRSCAGTSDFLQKFMATRDILISPYSKWSLPPYQTWIEITNELGRKHPDLCNAALFRLRAQEEAGEEFTEKQLRAEVAELERKAAISEIERMAAMQGKM